MMQVEDIWEALLSRDPRQIKDAFGQLSAAEQAAVLAHLDKMVHETGWHPEQVLSAQAALTALTVTRKQDYR